MCLIFTALVDQGRPIYEPSVYKFHAGYQGRVSAFLNNGGTIFFQVVPVFRIYLDVLYSIINLISGYWTMDIF